MTLDADGDVGIGTTNPTPSSTGRKVLVVEDTTNDAEIRLMGTSSSVLNLKALASGSFIGSNNDAPLFLQTNNANKMTILGNGKVGIGIDSPAEKLTVNGNFSVGSNLVVNTAGDVGINITTPTSTLHVEGSLNVSASLNIPLFAPSTPQVGDIWIDMS